MISGAAGKRFAGLLVVAVLLTIGLFLAPGESYAMYAGTMGTIYSVYAAGQSWTDVKETHLAGRVVSEEARSERSEDK